MLNNLEALGRPSRRCRRRQLRRRAGPSDEDPRLHVQQPVRRRLGSDRDPKMGRTRVRPRLSADRMSVSLPDSRSRASSIASGDWDVDAAHAVEPAELADRVHHDPRRPAGASRAAGRRRGAGSPFWLPCGAPAGPVRRRASAGTSSAHVRNGGFVFADDCNHDVDGLFARSFEAQMAEIFGATASQKLPNDHALYTRSSISTRGRRRPRSS